MSEYLSEEEQLARLRDWWKQNGVALLVGVVLVVAAIVGWRWYQSHQRAQVLTASDLYAEYQTAEGEQRDALARRIVDSGEGTAYPAFVLLHQADSAVAADDHEAAEEALRQAVAVASGPELADTARLRLARVLFELDRGGEALDTLRAIQGTGFLSLAAELKGDIHLARDERAEAHRSYLNARSHLEAEEQRPVLEMKIADTADAIDT